MTLQAQLSQEWITLQNNYEQYERGGLLIKLVTLVLTVIGLIFDLAIVTLSVLIIVLWLQESIFRTYQARLGQRILRVEGLIKQDMPANGLAFQLHAEWLANRQGTLGLLNEYIASAIKPTVAFPYALLLIGLIGLAV